MITKPGTLWVRWTKNPLFYQITQRYPDRDYKFQFALMCDYWLSKRRRLPEHVGAWEQWLKRSEPDPNVQNARRVKEEAKEMAQKMEAAPPVKQETLEKLRSMKERIGKKI